MAIRAADYSARIVFVLIAARRFTENIAALTDAERLPKSDCATASDTTRLSKATRRVYRRAYQHFHSVLIQLEAPW